MQGPIAATCLAVVLFSPLAVCAQSVRGVVKAHRLDSPVDCPSFETLREDGLLDEGSPRHDPWGNPWIIRCDGARVIVGTNGPDRQPGTEDDIRVPQE